MSSYLLDMVKRIEIAVGKGSNSFTMSRGSFKYRQTLNMNKPLKMHSIEDNDNSLKIHYKDGDNNYYLDIEKKGTRYDISFNGDIDNINRFRIIMPSDKDEHFFGCGETYASFDVKGHFVRIFVAEHQNTSRNSRKLVRNKLFKTKPDRIDDLHKYESYYAQPTYVSRKKYYMHADVSTFSEFDFRDDNKVVLTFQERPVFHLEDADSFEELSLKLSDLLGSYGSLPDWIYDGVILAVQEGEKVVDEKLETAFNADIKVNGVWCQDWCGCRRTGFGYQVMWNWEYDKEMYQNLKDKIVD